MQVNMDKTLILTYRKLDLAIAELDDWINGGEKVKEPFLLTKADFKKAEDRLADLSARLTALPVPNGVFEIVKSHMEDFLNALKAGLRSMHDSPGRTLGGFMWMYESVSDETHDCRSAPVRAEKALARFKTASGILSAAEELLKTASPLSLMEALGSCKENAENFLRYSGNVKEDFPGIAEDKAAELAKALKAFANDSKTLGEKIEQMLKNASIPAQSDEDSVIKMDGAAYAALLMDEHGVDLQELLEWHEEEIEKTRAAAFKIAQSLDIPERDVKSMGDVNDILLKYAGPADSPEEMLARGREYIKRTKTACREYVYMPEETCNVATVPEIIKLSYPWGGYGGGCHRRRPLVGEMFLNDYNYKAVTDGWIKMNTVHEAYPGHHVQFVRTTVDLIPETLKRGAKHTPITEGTPHRSEKMFEFVFPEDPFYPLFVAYRRHHTAVRIKADLMLRYYGNPIKDAVQLYMDEMGFDRDTARGQVKAQENMVGYFTTYYYGYKKLSQWESEYPFNEKEYTELLFSAGRMSLTNFKRFLDLTEQERRVFLHDFASLVQFNEDYTEKPIDLN